MNFFTQYKDLFQVGNIIHFPSERLRLDNELFIDRPYVPTYTQQHSLNSKLRQLKKDYNQFQSQVKELQQLETIPKRSQSRRKQTSNNNEMITHHRQRNNNMIQNSQNGNIMQNKSRNQYSHKKHQSTIFDHYQENQSQYFQNQNHKISQSRPEKSYQSPLIGSNQSLGKKINNQQQRFESSFANSLQQQPYSLNQKQNQSSPQKQYLQQLRTQNQQNTKRLVKNQNIMSNKFYQQDSNNVLKQSEINHIFNWKLQQQPTSLQNLPLTTIPKYKLQNNSLEQRQHNTQNNQRTFMIRNVPSTQQINSKKLITERKQNNHGNKVISALERRKIARQRIDQRREKLKTILKAFY